MYNITIQQVSEKSLTPKSALLKKWAKQALSGQLTDAELTIRLVDEKEMTDLNETYRKKKGPTNVLSFPFDMPEGIDLPVPILGDIVICTAVVNREAAEQHKAVDAHWAHMIVHGVFHLLGHDHENDQEADEMEALEIAVMQQLGFPNPYESGDEINNYD